MHRGALPARTFIAAVLPLLVSGCSSVVDIGPAWNTQIHTEECEELLSTLPVTIGGELARETTPQDLPAAAWGDPPIVLRCGVARPAGLTPTSSLTTIDGVNWFAEPLTNGVRFTSVPDAPTDSPLYVSLSIPSDYAPEGSLLVDIAPSIQAIR